MAGNHHAHIDHVEVVALQHHRYDVFANVVYVALDGGNDDFAFAAHVAPSGFVAALFFFNVGNQVRYRLLHHAGAFYHLRQEHFALPKQVAHHVHASHKRAFNHMQRPPALGDDFLIGFFSVLLDKLGNAVHHGVAQALAHRHGLLGRAAPQELFAVITRCTFG